MPKRDAPKPTKGQRNENRKNGKASKKGTVRHSRTPLTAVQKVLLSDGMYVNVAKRWAQNA